MDSFIEALYGRSEETIPEEYDWFAPLLGDWEFDYKDKFIDGDRSRPQRQLKGEWIFRRVLNGIGIEDMFICPSRATRETSPQPDGEYGVGLRIYNSKTHCYDMVYACKSKFTNLCFTMENGILTGITVDYMEIKNRDINLKISNPVLGIYKGMFNNDKKYQMLLNSEFILHNSETNQKQIGDCENCNMHSQF